jgi:hypothetical protein
LRRTLAARAPGAGVPGRAVVPGWEKALWAAVGVGAWMRSWAWSAPHEASLHLALRGLPGADGGEPSGVASPTGGGA